MADNLQADMLFQKNEQIFEVVAQYSDRTVKLVPIRYCLQWTLYRVSKGIDKHSN